MLLRSSSTPILKSLIHNHQPTLSPEPNLGVRIQTARPTSVALKNVVSMPRTSSETDLRRDLLKKKPSNLSSSLMVQPVLVEEKEEKEQEGKTTERVSFLGRGNVGVMEEEKVAVGGGGGGFGGGIFGKGGGDEGDGENPGEGSENLDVYYQKMIRAYPNDALLLGNYAKYLKEVRGDVVKAEEYCERAILAKASDVNVLSMYGDLIWNNHKDASRAQSYFDQALQSAPDDCYLLASYARFLGDAGEDEDDDEPVHPNDYEPRIDFAKGCPPTTIAATS